MGCIPISQARPDQSEVRPGNRFRSGQIRLCMLRCISQSGYIALHCVYQIKLNWVMWVSLGQVRLRRLVYVRLCYVGYVMQAMLRRLGYVGQVRSGYVGQVRFDQVRFDQVRLGQVRLGQVRLGQVRLRRSGQVRLHSHKLDCITISIKKI